jgi:hypothetical protein
MLLYHCIKEEDKRLSSYIFFAEQQGIYSPVGMIRG